MAIDVFGHGPLQLPAVNTEFFSDGPDRKRGPAKCRGVVGEGCYGQGGVPHDHACCCDPCRHKFNEVCTDGHCCRCVPKSICAIFTPDTETSGCKSKSWKMKPTTVDGRSVYSFNTVAGAISLSVGRNPIGYPGECTWQLKSEALSVDEVVAVDHSGSVNCLAPPEFVIENVNLPYYPVDAAPVDCFGTITFTQDVEAKVPFRYRWREQAEFIEGLSCATCNTVCSVLCVKRGNLYDYGYEYTRTNFIWSEADSVWRADDRSGQFISLHEQDGKCYLRLENITPRTLEGDLVEITACNLGMDLTVFDENSNFIRISCNPCSCWQFLCGELRCVCPTLCVVGVQDNVLVESFSLAWDKDNQRWGDDTFAVTPTRDAYGDCLVSVTGYAEPVPLRNDGGDEITINVSESVEDQLESGLVNFLSIACKRCATDCGGGGTCLEICDDVPSVLYAEVEPAPWTEMLGCNPAELCFDPITIPLVQTFVSSLENPAGEYRWQGCGIISCKICLSPTRTNHLVCIDLGCDGTGTFSLLAPGGEAGTPIPISVPIPCNSGLPVDTTLNIDTGGPLCCDEAGFIVRITE